MADESTQDEAAETRPWMPIEEIVDDLAEGCADYADGDDPGWFRIAWNPDSQELVIGYRPDDDEESGAQYRSTEHVFRLGAQARVGGPSLGEVAYAGYLEACGGKSLVSGAPLPAWGEQAEEIRAAWVAAAEAVRRAC